jgi:putative ABC transport system ATP-binding protein
MSLIRLRGVRKAYEDGRGRHEVLTGVDLDIMPGELVALLGPSGAGKSTLLNVVAGVDAADSGTVEVAGRELGAMDERGRTLLRRRSIGFVFQFFNLVPTLTVLENVLLPLELTGRASGRGAAAAAVAMARVMLERVALDHRADAFPEELSGGEQQRIAIARALVHEPALVLADEPTGNLDSTTGDHVMELLVGINRRRGTTVVLVTHNREVAGLADMVIALRDGRLVDWQQRQRQRHEAGGVKV